MATTTLPYIDKANGKVENGLCCAGCQVAFEKDPVPVSGSPSEAESLQDKVYSKSGFLEHFKHCRRAQSLWDASNAGTERTFPEEV